MDSSRPTLLSQLMLLLRERGWTHEQFFNRMAAELNQQAESVKKAFQRYAKGVLPRQATIEEYNQAFRKLGFPELMRQSRPLFDSPHPTEGSELAPIAAEGDNVDDDCFGWRRLARKLGRREYVARQLEDDAKPVLLNVDSTTVLTHFGSGIPPSMVALRPSDGVFRLADGVEAAIEGRPRDYLGPPKLAVTQWSGGNSDVAQFILEGFAVEPKHLKVAHDNYGVIRDQIGSMPSIYEKRSPIPGWLVLHGLSTTLGDEYLICVRRTTDVAYYPGFWTISWEEQANVDMGRWLTGEWPLAAAITAALQEEIVGENNPGAVLTEKMSVLGFCREFDLDPANLSDNKYRETSKVAVCTYPLVVYAPLELDLPQVWKAWRKARDAQFEHAEIVGIPPTFENLATVVSSSSLEFESLVGTRFARRGAAYPGRQRLHPSARVRVLLLMLKLYPNRFWDFVEQMERS